VHTVLIPLATETTDACPEQDLPYGQETEFMRKLLGLYSQNIDCYPYIHPKFPNSNKMPDLFLSIPSFYRRKKLVQGKKKSKRKNKAEFIIPSHLF